MRPHIVIGILILQMYAYGKEHATQRPTKLNILKSSLSDLNNKYITDTKGDINQNKETETFNSHRVQQINQDNKLHGFHEFNIVYIIYGFRYPNVFPALCLPSNDCTSENQEFPESRPVTTQKPTQPNLFSTETTNGPEFGILSRAPETLDNVNASFIEDEEDFSRPISFEPIAPVKGTKRLPLPVEHGSIQS